MRLKEKIYCNHEFIDQVLANRKGSCPHMIVYKMLDLLGDVYVDLDKKQLREKITTNDFYKYLSKKTNRGIHSAENWQSSFVPTDIADEVFLISHTDIPNYKQIRQRFGCLIVADDDIFYLNRLCKAGNFALIPVKNRLDFELIYNNSWSDVFEVAKVSPINAAVISDNFMFSIKYEERKEQSLFSILKSIIPADLAVPFHLTLFFCNDSGLFTKKQAEEIVSEIKDRHFCDDIKVTIVSHTKKSTTHDRKILTNYHYIYSGTGFNIISSNGIEEQSLGEVSCVFQNIVNISGHETKKHEYDYTQAWLKDIVDNHTNDNPCCFLVGDNINRLLKD